MPRDVNSVLRSSTSLRTWLLPLINLMEKRFQGRAVTGYRQYSYDVSWLSRGTGRATA